MKLVVFLLRSSLGTVCLAVLAGIVAGVSNTGLLVIINSALSKSDTPQTTLIWAFALLCLAMLVSRAASSNVNYIDEAIYFTNDPALIRCRTRWHANDERGSRGDPHRNFERFKGEDRSAARAETRI